MGMSLGGNGKQRAEINMTPMIDVLLVLIIIFMIIMPSKPVGLHTLVPQESTSADPNPPESHDIVITVHRDGKVELNQESLDIPHLRDRLLGIFSQQAVINVVFVKGDRDLDFADIAQVVDLTKGSGVRRIALMPN
jgi:biopolymer transport protein ExbD/biopolymer transport protein TolR